MGKGRRVSVFFFFQAEDGIRDYKVTGVQTCALPILQHAFAVHVVQLEPLDLRAVCERRVRRRQALRRPPYAAPAGAVQLPEGALQDPAPLEMRAVERAAERIEDEELRALAHFARNRVVAEPGNEFGDAARVGVGDLAHSRRIFASRINLPRRSFSERMWEANRSGVPPIGSAPSASRLVLTSGCSSALTSSAFSRATISRGVPAGASTPYQELAS